MKTLDEVIAELYIWDTCNKYPESFYDDEVTRDALYYLEEYKNKQNVGTMMFALHNTNKTVCNDCWLSREMVGEGFKQIYKKYIEEENPPLTWNELKKMEGKPVWIEHDSPSTKYQRWVLVCEYTDANKITIIANHLLTQIMPDEYGKTWQAYRKERE